MFRNEKGNCFDVFKEEREEKKMKNVTVNEEEKKNQSLTEEWCSKLAELDAIQETNETNVNMTLQKSDIYYGHSLDGTVYFVPKNCIDALNERVLVYVVKGGEAYIEFMNPYINEGLSNILDFPDDFYQKLSYDVESAPMFDDDSYDINERWKGVRRPKVFYDADVLESIEYMNQQQAYKVNIKPTGFYLHYEQKSPYLEPFEAVEYLGEDNRYYYLSVAQATGKEEF